MNVMLHNVFGNGSISCNIEGRKGNIYTTSSVEFRYACLAAYILTGNEFYYFYGTSGKDLQTQEERRLENKLYRNGYSCAEIKVIIVKQRKWREEKNKIEYDKLMKRQKEWQEWKQYRKSL